jgi:Skp family chaperone for outer membrane proteins
VFAQYHRAREFTAALREKVNLRDQNVARWQKERAEFRELLERHDPRYKEEDLEKAIIDRQRALEDGKRAVDRLLDKESAPRFTELCDEITAAAKAYAESEGFATLFAYCGPSDARALLATASADRKTKQTDRSGIVLLYAHPSCEITDRLIARLNRVEKQELPKKTKRAK